MSPAKRRPARRQPAARERAIGIFDSGIGGLTVVRALRKLLPNEELIYLGDTGRYPYGTKSADVVRRYSLENTEFLVDKGIKLLVVACNTSTAVALDAVQARFDVPVVGVIEPGAQAAARASRNRKVGVIAHRGNDPQRRVHPRPARPAPGPRDLYPRLPAVRAAGRGGMGRQRGGATLARASTSPAWRRAASTR